ncbi:MAG: hypothetical protein ACE5E6_10735 [Phycisphaerae bacterium]
MVVCLAVGVLIVLLGAAASGPLGGAWTSRHVALALFALLLSASVQVVIFTYLTVSAKVIHQTVALGRLPHRPLDDVRRLKRSMTHCLGAVVASLVLAAATGGATWRLPEQRSLLHLVAAAVVIVVHTAAYYRQYNLVVRMSALLAAALRAYAAHARPSAPNAPSP